MATAASTATTATWLFAGCLATGARGVARVAARRGIVAVIAVIAVVVVIVVVTRAGNLRLAVAVVAALASAARAPGASATEAAPAVGVGADGAFTARDAYDRVLRPEAEEPGFTLSDDVDVDLVAAEPQLIESPPDCLVDRLSARLRYRHWSSSFRSGPRRGPQRSG